MGNGLRESDLTLSLAHEVRASLAHYDVRVEMTRTDDRFVGLSERAQFANSHGADYFYSLHINAGGGEGYEDYVHTEASAAARQYRDAVHIAVMQYLAPLGVVDRGECRANFAVLRETSMPAILTENLFIDTAADAARLENEEFLAGLAQAHARGIVAALHLPRRTDGDGAPSGVFTAELQVNFSDGRWRVIGLPGAVHLGGPERWASVKVAVDASTGHWLDPKPMTWDAPPLGK